MGGIFAGWNFRWVEFSLGGIFVGGIFAGWNFRWVEFSWVEFSDHGNLKLSNLEEVRKG